MLKSSLKISLLAITLLWVCSCTDDDLKNAAAISSKKVALTKDRTYGMDVTYSDSGVVKAKGYAPIYDKVKPKEGSIYNEMPQGVKLEFYDAYLQVTGTITSKYCINDETKRTTIFRKNVIVVNDKMTFTTEELTWDENLKLYSSPYGTVVTKGGDVLTGSAFSAPQDFSSYKINTATAEGYVKNDFKP